MSNKKIAVLIGSFLSLLWAPAALAALVACGNGSTPCTWNDLYILGSTVTRFLIINIGVPLATLVIVLSGVQLVLNPNNATAKTVWKERLWKGLIGLFIIMCAYLLVKVVVWGLTGDQPGQPDSDFYNLRSKVNQ